MGTISTEYAQSCYRLFHEPSPAMHLLSPSLSGSQHWPLLLFNMLNIR